MGLSVRLLTFATISGASCANLSSTRITPSLVGITATLPPCCMITQRLSVTFSMVMGGCGCCCCAQAIQSPATASVANVTRVTTALRKTMDVTIPLSAFLAESDDEVLRPAAAGVLPAVLFAAIHVDNAAGGDAR